MACIAPIPRAIATHIGWRHMVLGRWITAGVLALLGLIGPTASAQALLPVPPLAAHVTDATATLAPAAQQALEGKLTRFEQSSGTQIAVLLVPTTQPEDIAAYANRVANTWKIGRREVGDGVLLVVAKNDRAVRIEVAKTLEGAVPDLAAYEIIEQTITPAFRRGDFAGGLDAAADQLMARIQGEALPAPRGEATHRAAGEGSGRSRWDGLVLLFFVLVPIGSTLLRSLLGRKLGAALTGAGAGLLAFLFTTSVVFALLGAVLGGVLAFAGGSPWARRGYGSVGSGGWHSGGSLPGWGGGGGFRSGGGGDFGGGGASGRW